MIGDEIGINGAKYSFLIILTPLFLKIRYIYMNSKNNKENIVNEDGSEINKIEIINSIQIISYHRRINLISKKIKLNI